MGGHLPGIVHILGLLGVVHTSVTGKTILQEHLDYCSMEAIAERWKSKPRESEAASMHPEAAKRQRHQAFGLRPGDQEQEASHSATG